MPRIPAPKIPATVVTGFLGAGKTTMIRHLLNDAGGRRIALVVNEFGTLGVDGDLLRGCCAEDDVVELSNGCICCTVADDFVPAMEKLVARAPDHIVIETSGLALPQPLIRAFAWPGLADKLTVDGVVTVVDGAALSEGRFAWDEGAVAAQRAKDDPRGDAPDHDRPIAELFEDQVACADMIVLNKADLLSPADRDALAERIGSQARPGVRVVAAERGALPAAVLLGLGAGAEADMAARRAPHHEGEAEEEHDHDEFETFVVDVPEVADPASFRARLSDAIAAHGILRAKGFLPVAGKPMRLLVQAAGPRVEARYDRPWGGDARAGRLVVIGEAGLDRAAIERMLAP